VSQYTQYSPNNNEKCSLLLFSHIAFVMKQFYICQITIKNYFAVISYFEQM